MAAAIAAFCNRNSKNKIKTLKFNKKYSDKFNADNEDDMPETNLNSSNLLNKQFGWNILPQQSSSTEYKQGSFINTAANMQKNAELFIKHKIEDFGNNPFAMAYSVSQEEIAENLRKAQAQIYALGQVMRDETPQSTFSVKF